jgi:hypothetical protein
LKNEKIAILSLIPDILQYLFLVDVDSDLTQFKMARVARTARLATRLARLPKILDLISCGKASKLGEKERGGEREKREGRREGEREGERKRGGEREREREGRKGAGEEGRNTKHQILITFEDKDENAGLEPSAIATRLQTRIAAKVLKYNITYL